MITTTKLATNVLKDLELPKIENLVLPVKKDVNHAKKVLNVGTGKTDGQNQENVLMDVLNVLVLMTVGTVMPLMDTVTPKMNKDMENVLTVETKLNIGELLLMQTWLMDVVVTTMKLSPSKKPDMPNVDQKVILMDLPKPTMNKENAYHVLKNVKNAKMVLHVNNVLPHLDFMMANAENVVKDVPLAMKQKITAKHAKKDSSIKITNALLVSKDVQYAKT